MSPHRRFLLILVPLVAALLGAEGTEDGGVYEASRHGVVSGPLGAPTEPRTGAVARLQKEFTEARTDLDEGRLDVAAKRFDGIYDEAGWGEAAYNAALAYYGLGRYDVALDRTGRVVQKLPEDLAGLHLRGVLLRLHGRYADAEAVSDGALALARERSDRYAEAMGLLNLATSRRFLGRPDAAGRAVDAARALGESLDRAEIVAAAWLVTGYLARDQGDARAAEDAFKASRRSGLGRSEQGAQLDVRLADVEDAIALGETKKAARMAAALVEDVRAQDGRQMRAVHLLRLAEIEHDLGRPEAEQLLAEAEALFVQGGVEVGRADVLAARARWRFDAGDLTAAEALLVPCIAIRESLQVPLALAGSRLMLAQVRLEEGRLDEASALSRDAEQVLGAAGQAREHRAALLVQGDVFLQAADLDGAMRVAEQVAAASRSPDAREDLIASLVVQTLVLARRGDPDAAAAAWKRGLRASDRPTARQQVRIELALAHALEDAGRPADALVRGRAALAAIDAAPDDDPVRAPALRDVAVETIVASMIAAGDTDAAGAFLQSIGRGEGDLADVVRSRADGERHNAAVALYEEGHLAAARDAFRALVDDPGVDAGLRQSASRNLGASLEGLARADLTRGALADAEKGYLDLLSLARATEDRRVEARAGFRLAEIRSRVEDPVGAADYAEAAATAAKAAAEPDLEASLWAMAGDLMFERDPPRARVNLRNALGAWGTDEATLGKRASVTYNLALLSYQLDDNGEAAVRVQEARVLAGRAGRADLVKMADELAAALKE